MNHMNTTSRYHITLQPKGCTIPTELYANTYKEIADSINDEMGYTMLSRGVVTNWISRKNKSPKYSWIDVQFNSNRAMFN